MTTHARERSAVEVGEQCGARRILGAACAVTPVCYVVLAVSSTSANGTGVTATATVIWSRARADHEERQVGLHDAVRCLRHGRVGARTCVSDAQPFQ